MRYSFETSKYVVSTIRESWWESQSIPIADTSKFDEVLFPLTESYRSNGASVPWSPEKRERMSHLHVDKDEARAFWVSSVLISIAIGTLFWLLIFSLKSWWRCSIAALVEFSKDRSAIAEKKWKRFESAGLSSERQWQCHRQIVSYRIRFEIRSTWSSLAKPDPALQQPFSRDLEFDPDLYQSIGKSCASHLPVGLVLHERSWRGPWVNGCLVSRWVELWFFLSHILVASKKHGLWLPISNVHEI